jgi:hypothetical protein
MTKLLKLFTLLDWCVGAVCLVLGLYTMNGWLLSSGIIAFAVAWFRPAEKVNAYIKKKFMRKAVLKDDTAAILAEDAFYEMMAPAPAPSEVPLIKKETISYIGKPQQYAKVALSGYVHNKLKPGHLQLKTSSSSIFH